MRLRAVEVNAATLRRRRYQSSLCRLTRRLGVQHRCKHKLLKRMMIQTGRPLASMKMTLEMMRRRKKNLLKKKRKRNLILKMKKSTSATGPARFAMTIKPAAWSWSVLDRYKQAT